MSGVRLLVGTRNGAFVLAADAKRSRGTSPALEVARYSRRRCTPNSAPLSD